MIMVLLSMDAIPRLCGVLGSSQLVQQRLLCPPRKAAKIGAQSDDTHSHCHQQCVRHTARHESDGRCFINSGPVSGARGPPHHGSSVHS
ncbi:hypothetical protein PSPO01_12669 [Paraphaeosphaeria sporulosa]